MSQSQASGESSEPATQVAVYDGGRIALVRRSEGSGGNLGLPVVTGWNGNAWLYRAAITALGEDVPAPLRGPLTHLTPLTLGQDVMQVALVEARTPGVAADGWWSPGDQPPPDVPTTAARALHNVLESGEQQGSDDDGEAVAWPPFCRPGFTRALTATIEQDTRLAPRATMRLTAGAPDGPHDLEQLQGWALSSVWANRQLVLKFTNPAWPAEPPVTELLSQIAPHLVPEVLATGQVAGSRVPYLAQARVVEPPDPDESEEADNRQRTAAVLLAMAELQGRAAQHVEALARAGVKARSAAATAAQLPDLWEALHRAADRQPEGDLGKVLSEEQRRQLPELDRLLRRDLRELESAPPVLVHGDLHLGNVMQDEAGRPQLIDWTDAAFAWPGVDLWMPLSRLTLSPAQREELLQAYLGRLGPEHELGLRIGARVAPVYHALSNLEIAGFLPRDLRADFHGFLGWLLRRQFAEYGL